MKLLTSISFRVLRARKLSMSGMISVVILCAISMWAQTISAQSQPSPTPPQTDTTSTATPAPQKADTTAAKADDPATQKPMTPEEARQAQLVADTNKLYQLAQELQAEVAKSTKNTLSLAVVKKAAEVEKLAKSLKERMKNE
jgi:hypothetical protein